MSSRPTHSSNATSSALNPTRQAAFLSKCHTIRLRQFRMPHLIGKYRDQKHGLCFHFARSKFYCCVSNTVLQTGGPLQHVKQSFNYFCFRPRTVGCQNVSVVVSNTISRVSKVGRRVICCEEEISGLELVVRENLHIGDRANITTRILKYVLKNRL